MESWITLFTAHGKAKVQLSHVLQTELPTIPKDSQLYTLPTMPTTTESISLLIPCKTICYFAMIIAKMNKYNQEN